MLKIRSKKGVSVLIGYVLLVVFVIITSAVVFRWLKTYVPAEKLDCPDGVSLFVKEAAFDEATSKLNVTIKNNGRFDVDGFFVHATNTSGQKLATIDLAKYLNPDYGGSNGTNFVFFYSGDESQLVAGNELKYVFEIPTEIGKIYLVQVTPARFQEKDGRNTFVSCASSKTEQLIGAPIVEPPDEPQTCESLGYTCNPPGWDQSDSQGGTLDCGDCTDPQSCSVDGTCQNPPPLCGNGVTNSPAEECDNGTTQNVPPAILCNPSYETNCASCSDICEIVEVVGPYCGDLKVNGNEVCDGNSALCTVNGYAGTKTCNPSCNEFDSCTTTLFCGDGTTNGNEACDDQNTNDNDACKNDCTLSTSTDCSNNCVLEDYSWGYCTTQSSCGSQGGTNEFSGNQFCGAGQGRCCCLT